MGRRFKRFVFWLLVVLLIAITSTVYFSPFSHNSSDEYRTVEATVRINAPAEVVFDFMGNSDYASNWSVYVDHISTLNDGEYSDGKLGSKRRCFRYKDESKQRWDEEIIAVKENKLRRLSIYNLEQFPMESQGLLTEQVYKDIDANTTELSLTVFYKDDNPSVWDWFKTKLGAYEIKRIFKGNLKNIKRLIEAEND